MSKSKWIKIKSNLYRNSESDQYYARVTVKGVDTWKTLETSLRTIADLKLPAAIARIRAGKGALQSSNLTLEECAAIYSDRLKERGYRRKRQLIFKKHKPRSLKYREETLAALRALWTDFNVRRAALVTASECHEVADKVRRKYSSTRFNGAIQTMRGILEIAVESGVLESNPADAVALAAVQPAEISIPSREQVTEILRELDAQKQRRFSRLCVRGLMFTGLRPNEARHLKPADVDLQRGSLTARETKNGKPRTIQLIPQALELFKEEGVAKVLTALRKDPRRTLRTIAAKLGLKLTPYTMRHLHMTALLESGADIATVATIAGHGDRGVTLLRHYSHARSEHVRKQLEKVVI